MTFPHRTIIETNAIGMKIITLFILINFMSDIIIILHILLSFYPAINWLL